MTMAGKPMSIDDIPDRTRIIHRCIAANRAANRAADPVLYFRSNDANGDCSTLRQRWSAS
jgi:hypothetical protein